jgi:hypothetical protein
MWPIDANTVIVIATGIAAFIAVVAALVPFRQESPSIHKAAPSYIARRLTLPTFQAPKATCDTIGRESAGGCFGVRL